MEQILENWTDVLQKLKEEKDDLIIAYEQNPTNEIEIKFNYVLGKIEILEKCIKLQKI